MVWSMTEIASNLLLNEVYLLHSRKIISVAGFTVCL